MSYLHPWQKHSLQAEKFIWIMNVEPATFLKFTENSTEFARHMHTNIAPHVFDAAVLRRAACDGRATPERRRTLNPIPVMSDLCQHSQPIFGALVEAGSRWPAEAWIHARIHINTMHSLRFLVSPCLHVHNEA